VPPEDAEVVAVTQVIHRPVVGLSTPEKESASAEKKNDEDDNQQSVCVHGLGLYRSLMVRQKLVTGCWLAIAGDFLGLWHSPSRC